MIANVDSIQVGMPQTIPGDKPWTSGFLKQPITGPVWLGLTNLKGDGQDDVVHHGGPHKAVCVYPAAHYPYWHQTLDLPNLRGGDFGENLTIRELTERDFCIGDVCTVGDAVVQVSQPRQPCWKLARRWQIKDLAFQVQQTGRTGWYFRVLSEGMVAPGQSLEVAENPHPQWSIAVANEIMHHDKKNLQMAAQLASLPELSPSWRETLIKRINQKSPLDERERLEGDGT